VLRLNEHSIDSDVSERGMHAILDALQQNRTCQALYMHGHSYGCTDGVVLHLCDVLKYKTSCVWCLNMGELDNVNSAVWETFVGTLPHTQVTHLYVSENVGLSRAMKKKAQEHLRVNRTKHTLHCSWWNERVIKKCIGCWWNPWNAWEFKCSMWYKKHGGVVLVGNVFRAWRGCTQ
jgi:hypothetical protein